MPKKASVTLAGVPLAATSPVVWRFTTGAAPYTTTFSVHEDQWPRLKASMGQPLTLKIVDARAVETSVRNVTILHEVASDNPHRVSFVVADRRWKLPYELVARDYNIPRKTGDLQRLNNVPVEASVDVDVYRFRRASLNQGRKWTAKQIVEDVLRLSVGDSGRAGYRIQSFPSDELTIQNLMLRDPADVALSRVLAYVPGADVYVNKDGRIVVFDATDLEMSQGRLDRLPPLTYEGDHPVEIKRRKIRPSRIHVYYQRQIEALLDFDDDYNTTVSERSAEETRGLPYLDNVVQTVDDSTTVTEYDPQSGSFVTKTVTPGTYVEIQSWLEDANTKKPEGSDPWTFETLRVHWVHGDLDGVLGARGLDFDESANVAMRVATLKQHFRQTFRLNQRYVDALQSILPFRAALLDPVTGARAPAAAWGQYCVIPSSKGLMIYSRFDPDNARAARNVDGLARYRAGEPLVATAPGPVRVEVLDSEQGILRTSYVVSPYGTVESFLPSHLIGESSSDIPRVPSVNTADVDDSPLGYGFRVESATNAIFLRQSTSHKLIVTVIPAAPNDLTRFHRETVTLKDIPKDMQRNLGIDAGEGPEMHVFVAPNELAARYAIGADSDTAQATLRILLGLDDETPEPAQVVDLPGYVFVNRREMITPHAVSVAAEIWASFADAVDGRAVTIPDRDTGKLVGNMSSAAVVVDAAPSANVRAVYEFSGVQRPVSRFGLLPESARQLILGTISI